MKTTYTSIVSILLLSAVMRTYAQQPAGISSSAGKAQDELMMLDIFGIIPKNSPVARCGGGGGFNVLSRAFNLGRPEDPQRLQVRFGGGLYFSALMSKRFRDVPLDGQPGNASVKLKSGIFGINAMARFSEPMSKRFTPYVDLFAGFRNFNAQMDISPYDQPEGSDNTSVQTLPSLWQFNYGASLGISAALCKTVRFFASGTVSYALKNERTIGIKNSRIEAGELITGEVTVARPFFMANVGFCFLIDPKNDMCSSRGVRVHNSHHGGSGTPGGKGGGGRVKVSTRPAT